MVQSWNVSLLKERPPLRRSGNNRIAIKINIKRPPTFWKLNKLSIKHYLKKEIINIENLENQLGTTRQGTF